MQMFDGRIFRGNDVSERTPRVQTPLERLYLKRDGLLLWMSGVTVRVQTQLKHTQRQFQIEHT